MGRSMKLVRATSPGAEPEVVVEATAHPLMHGALALPHAVRPEFPLLARIRVRSEAYVDEAQTLGREDVVALLEELRRLRRVCARTEFLANVDGLRVFDSWRTRGIDGDVHAPGDFNAWLDTIEAMLERAVVEDLSLRLAL